MVTLHLEEEMGNVKRDIAEDGALVCCVAVTYVFGLILGGTLKGYAVQRHFWHIF